MPLDGVVGCMEFLLNCPGTLTYDIPQDLGFALIEVDLKASLGSGLCESMDGVLQHMQDALI